MGAVNETLAVAVAVAAIGTTLLSFQHVYRSTVGSSR
jgi:hypothetical protein